jgi:hypothetical protein
MNVVSPKCDPGQVAIDQRQFLAVEVQLPQQRGAGDLMIRR